MTFSPFRLTDVHLNCACGGMHREHYEIRTTEAPSRFVTGGCDHCQTCRGITWQTPTISPAPEAVFSNYRTLLREEATRPIADWTFKSNPVYRQFLEHVTAEQGAAYLKLLQESPNWGVKARSLIAEAALINDSVGTPIRSDYDALGITCSPTNFRYAHHASLIWQHITDLGLSTVHLVEIGGGYGGLALFIQKLVPLFYTSSFSYTIVDVPESGPIQKAYGNHLKLNNLRVVDGTDKVAIEDVVDATQSDTRYLISAYGFSELSSGIRDWYEELLTQYCSHGFLLWNRVEPYPLAPGVMTIVDDPVLTETGVRMVLY